VRHIPWRRQLSRLGQIIGIATAASVIASAVALASFPGANGVIAYAVGEGPQQGIWAVDPATGGQRQLTSGPDEAPSFSASGDLLAFQRREAAGSTIFIARADGSGARPIVRGSEPAFSPNGRQIVFVRKGGLFLTGTTAGSPVRQVTHQLGDSTPQWSSKGSIVFERTDIRHATVACFTEARLKSLTERKRPENRGEQQCAAGNVSHERILEHISALDVITPPSLSAREVLTVNESLELWPDWSPDGKTLAVNLCIPHDHSLAEPHLRSFIVYTSPPCVPAVWAPNGGKPIRPGGSSPGFSWGGYGTSCPRYIPYGTEKDYVRAPAGNFEKGFYTGHVRPEEEPKSPAQFSWQPLLPGTMRVPTVKCLERPEPGVEHGFLGQQEIDYSIRLHSCHRVRQSEDCVVKPKR
jgi:WD40-like Beta Propeller Repeat